MVVQEPHFTPPSDFKLSVLIPIYNERRTVKEILRRVRAVALPKEIIMVDDGSTDGTRDILRGEIEAKLPDEHVFFHERNRGKGAAVRTAITHATGTVCLIQDADLEYDPRDYFRLLAPILDGRADVVYGSRFIGVGPNRVHLFWHYVGNRVLTLFCNMFTNLNLTDMETCYNSCSRGSGPYPTIFLIRSSFIPELVETKGLADEIMMGLPAMYLTHVAPIKLKTHLRDGGKRRKHDRCRWPRRLSLVARNPLLLLP